MSKPIINTTNPVRGTSDRDMLNAFEKEAERQLNQYYPIRTRREHWDFLTTLDWRKYRHDVRLPPSRWSEEIQLGTYGQLSFYLRGTYRLLYHRSQPTSGPGSRPNDDETASTDGPNTDRTNDNFSRLVSSAGSDSIDSLDLGRDGTNIGIESTMEDTGIGDTGNCRADSLASSQDSDDIDEYFSSTDSSLIESDEDDDDQPRGQIMIRIQFPEAHRLSASPTFAQLGLVTARENAPKTGLEGRGEWPTGYHLAVNLDNTYAPAALWFLSTKPRKPTMNTYKSPSVRQMPHFAAAQIALSLEEMSNLHASELEFKNVQKEYTLLS